jgi:hypothetical protein
VGAIFSLSNRFATAAISIEAFGKTPMEKEQRFIGEMNEKRRPRHAFIFNFMDAVHVAQPRFPLRQTFLYR